MSDIEPKTVLQVSIELLECALDDPNHQPENY